MQILPKSKNFIDKKKYIEYCRNMFEILGFKRI